MFLCRRLVALSPFANEMVNVGCAGAVSTGERNTLIFLERWSVTDEVSYADVLHCRTEVRYVGSVATRRVDEFDWSALQSCVVFDLSAFALARIIHEGVVRVA